jgi:hypothetical protein
MKKKISEYLIEALLIVFSVILALVLNEYRNGLLEEKELNAILSNVKAEIENNKSIVEELIPYHKKGIDNLDSILLNNLAIDSVKSRYGLKLLKIFPQGFYRRQVSNSAWEVFKSTGMISKIDIDKAQFLSRLYTQQEIAFLPVFDIVDFTTERGFLHQEKAEENLIIISRHMEELYGRENALLGMYREGVKILK